MPAAYFIVVEKPLPGLDASAAINGVALAEQESVLNGLARKAGVTPLMNFISMGEDHYAAFVDEEEEDETGGVGQPANEGEALVREQWFNAVDGIKTVEALMAQIVQKPGELDKHEQVLEELRTMRVVLEAADASDTRWHLLIDV